MNLEAINLDNISSIKTEEATKTGLILPFLNQLGYNVFDISEVIPEYTADIAKKQGEKVDFAIKIDNSIGIIIEAKEVNEKLSPHSKQLSRYFVNTEAKIGILTNGIEYWFFTDLEKDNIMDEEPFFKFNLKNHSETDLNQLLEFSKEKFDANRLYGNAEDFRIKKNIAKYIVEQFSDPSDEFVKVIMNGFYEGVKTQNAVSEYKDYIIESYKFVIEKEMLKRMFPNQDIDVDTPDSSEDRKEEKVLVTTETELAIFNHVQTILYKSEKADNKRISWSDNHSYFNILIDRKKTKWFVRVYDKKKDLKIGIFNESGENLFLLNNTIDIYEYEQKIIEAFLVRS